MTIYLPDVNVVVASVRADHPHHEQALGFCTSVDSAASGFVVPVEVAAAATRVLMAPAWIDPESSQSAAALVGGWIEAAGAEVIGHPPAALTVLAEFARTMSLTPRQVPDALLASSAIVLRACLVTFDRGFGRYPGLRSQILTATG